MKIKQKSDTEKILNAVKKYKILTKKDLVERTKISDTCVIRIIQHLKKEKKISYEKIFGIKRIFLAKEKREKLILHCIKQDDVYSKIIQILQRKKSVTLDEISESLGKARSTTFVRMKKLIDEGIIKKVLISRKPHYQLK